MTEFTRRELALALSGSAVALAQSPETAPSNANDELKAWLAQIQQTANQLNAFPLPMTAQPATIFKP